MTHEYKLPSLGDGVTGKVTEILVKVGDKVIVETDRGRAMATVVVPPHEVAEHEAPEGLKSIQRLATEEVPAQGHRAHRSSQEGATPLRDVRRGVRRHLGRRERPCSA